MSNSFCSVCPAFSDSGPESADPSKCLCNVGYFGAVLQDCSACPAGKYSTDVGLMQESDCLLCTAGSYSEQAWSSWTKTGARPGVSRQTPEPEQGPRSGSAEAQISTTTKEQVLKTESA